ncbi:uncharacterized protein [Channa argus]|uniref:uncharacterized protein n=1 Tax=Channa argus TaxID=215402 RepID=UPI00351FA1F7
MDDTEEMLETRSQCSSTSRSSQRSSASLIAAQARAKAESARTQASFAQKEADLIKTQAYIEEEKQKATAEAARKTAELNANLHALRLERAAAAAIAEAEVLEAAAKYDFEDVDYQNIKKDDARDATTGSMADVHQATKLAHPLIYPSHQVQMDNGESTMYDVRKDNTQSKEIREYNSGELPVLHASNHNVPNSPNIPQAQSLSRNTNLHQYHRSPSTCEYKPLPYNADFHPRQSPPQPTPRTNETNSSATIDLAKYLIRRELVSSGLLTFDDKPENYWAWKTSFLSSTEDLNLTPREELDLLCKWLGPKSSEQAKRIRAVCIHNASSGVSMVWQRLQECYGSPEAIENALLNKVDEFPKITTRENHRLRDLGDILMELDAARTDGFLPGLNYLDTSRGINPIVQKLPHHLHERWISFAARYKDGHHSAYPPFSVFVKFVCNQAKTLNDPSFTPLLTGGMNPPRMEKPYKSNFRASVSVRKTEVSTSSDANYNNSDKSVMDPDKQCPLHNKPHPLSKCRGFRSKSLDERKTFLKEKNICYKCCSSTNHMAKNCNENVQCRECNSRQHLTALHPGPAPWKSEISAALEIQGGEHAENLSPAVISKCTDVCGRVKSSRSCAKISLVKIYPSGQKEKAVKTYVVFDEQSNKSLAKTEFFELFGIKTDVAVYTLKTCSGVVKTAGRRANNFIVESLDGKVIIPLPTLIECDMLPDDRSEIPTPEVAGHYAHLKQVADKIPAIDENAAILILLGRDILRVHKVREHCNGPHNAPYAQRLDLGWVIIGEVCLGGAHVPANVNVYKTCVLYNGRTSLFEPCNNGLHVKEEVNTPASYTRTLNITDIIKSDETDSLGEELFRRTPHDDIPTISVDEKVFLDILDKEMFVNEANSWTAPLPFRSPRHRLPNNRDQAVKRFTTLCCMLNKRPEMNQHFFAFMKKIFDLGHAEPAPPLNKEKECWYLPIFGVYHPRKPGQIRVVYDSSATHEGISLNSVLLSGPDLNNTLLGVLIRFRKEPVAVTADIQQMFYCFTVREDHRDFLRFLWFEDNDPENPIREYRLTVHVFGNSPSPAIAIYGLKRAALERQDSIQFNSIQFNFIYIAPIYNKVISRHFTE